MEGLQNKGPAGWRGCGSPESARTQTPPEPRACRGSVGSRGCGNPGSAGTRCLQEPRVCGSSESVGAQSLQESVSSIRGRPQ